MNNKLLTSRKNCSLKSAFFGKLVFAFANFMNSQNDSEINLIFEFSREKNRPINNAFFYCLPLKNKTKIF